MKNNDAKAPKGLHDALDKAYSTGYSDGAKDGYKKGYTDGQKDTKEKFKKSTSDALKAGVSSAGQAMNFFKK